MLSWLLSNRLFCVANQRLTSCCLLLPDTCGPSCHRKYEVVYLPIFLGRFPALSLISVVLQLRSVTVSRPIAPAKIVPNKIGTGKLVISHVENESEAFKRGRIWVWMRMVLAKKSPRIFRVSLCVSQLNVSFLRPITHDFISCPVDCGPNCNPGK